jgi:glycerophosphoryl diester phosphodiesterase
MLRTLARRLIRGIGHVKAPTPKHVENSNRGDRRAKRQGKDGNDLDLQITKDNRIVNTHWARPMIRDGFRDPYGQIPRHRMVRQMTWAEVSRLVAGRWPRRYRIRSVEQALRHCARLGVVAVLEPKGDPRFRLDWPWQHIAAVAEDVGATVSVRALRENAAALEPARRAGFKAWEI